MKNKLEKDIIDNIYRFEKKRTQRDIVTYVISFLITLIFLIGLSIILLMILYQQDTLSLFELFGEDADIIKQNIGDVLQVFYIELPKQPVLLLLLGVLLLVGMITLYFRNKDKIRKKLLILKKHEL